MKEGLSTEKVLSCVPMLHSYFASLDQVLIAYLFGSHARNQAGPESDVDIAVLLHEPIDDDDCFAMRLNMIADVSDVLKYQEIDVIILNQASLVLRYHVVHDGLVLYCRDEQTRIMFTSRCVMEYLDFKPMLERQQRAILKRLSEGNMTNGHDPHRGALERYRQLRTRIKATPSSDI